MTSQTPCNVDVFADSQGNHISLEIEVHMTFRTATEWVGDSPTLALLELQ